MSETIEAIFDGEVLGPEKPIGLSPNTRVRITIEATIPPAGSPNSFLRTAEALNLEGPPDWSTRIEEPSYQSNFHSDE